MVSIPPLEDQKSNKNNIINGLIEGSKNQPNDDNSSISSQESVVIAPNASLLNTSTNNMTAALNSISTPPTRQS